MKITKQQLNSIIQEEMTSALRPREIDEHEANQSHQHPAAEQGAAPSTGNFEKLVMEHLTYQSEAAEATLSAIRVLYKDLSRIIDKYTE